MDLTWLDKQIAWFVAMLEITLTALIAWMLAGLILGTLPTVGIAQVDLGDAETQHEIFPLKSLIDAALFGHILVHTVTVPKLAPPPRPAVKMVKKIKLNLQLKGVIYAGEHSVALIVAEPGMQQEVFHIGDEISTGVVLTRIAMDSIFVDIQGQEQQVWLDFVTLNNQLADTIPSAANPTSMRPPLRNINRFSGAVGSGRQATPQRVVRQVSRQMLDKELQDFSKLLMQARVLPHIENGKPDGFMITNISPGSLYQKIGLVNGDIIKMVNGVPIRSMAQAMGLYQQLRDASKIEMSLLRQGRLQHIQFNIQ